MSKNFQMFGAFTKVDDQEDGTIIVRGIASSEAVDSDGEIITSDAVRKAIPSYMKFGNVREMHRADSAVGVAVSIGVNDDGVTEFEAHVVDPLAVKKCQTGVYKGFSLGGKKMDRDELNKRKITAIKLNEISLVDRPANPDAVFELAKLDNGSEQEGAMEGELTDLKKGMYDVSRFADLLCSLGYVATGAVSEAVYEGDASPVPAKIKAGLVALADAFKAMAAEEVDEMLAGIKAGGVPDVLAMASETGDLKKQLDELAKKGAAFSQATKDKMAKAHDHIKAADAAMTDTGYDSGKDDDASKGEGGGDLNKGTTNTASDPDALAKVAKLEGELEDLRKSVTEKDAAIAEKDAEIKDANEVLTDLLKKFEDRAPAALAGATGAVEKADDGKKEDLSKTDSATGSNADPLQKSQNDAKAAIKDALRKGGHPFVTTAP